MTYKELRRSFGSRVTARYGTKSRTIPGSGKKPSGDSHYSNYSKDRGVIRLHQGNVREHKPTIKTRLKGAH